MPSEAELSRFEEEYYPAVAAYHVAVRLHPVSLDTLKRLSPPYLFDKNPDYHLKAAQVLLFAITGLIEGLWRKKLIKPMKHWEVRIVEGPVVADLAGVQTVVVRREYTGDFTPGGDDWTQQVHVQVQAVGGEQLPLSTSSAQPSIPSLEHAWTWRYPKSDDAMVWFNPAYRGPDGAHGHQVDCKTHTFRDVHLGSAFNPEPNKPSFPIFQFLFHHSKGIVKNGRELFRMRWHAPEWADRRQRHRSADAVRKAVFERFTLKSDKMFEDSPEALDIVFQTSVFEAMPRSHFTDA